jgi:hypothetical protein
LDDLQLLGEGEAQFGFDAPGDVAKEEQENGEENQGEPPMADLMVA